MYRYSVDNAVTYTSEDFVLFRESPFACWMERLTLENPDHGIPPDIGSQPPGNTMESQQELAETLRAESRNVVLVPWQADEPSRRSATLAAMRQGADFIVDGQLAHGPLSGSANLLMRTSGFSELGNYLYMPCDTQGHTTLQSAFRLCFLADLLHSLQGQLPPQMLIIRGGGDLLQQQTEDHIYHYQAVKQRFMAAMRDFRKHRMPDPAESAHFGRWAECANEVLRQRMLRAEPEEQILAEEQELPLAANAPVAEAPQQVQAQSTEQRSAGTLAEQARQLQPGTYTSERRPPPYVHGGGDVGSKISTSSISSTAGVVDAALENLEFIGSAGGGRPVAASPAEAPAASLAPASEPQAPAASLGPAREPEAPAVTVAPQVAASGKVPLSGLGLSIEREQEPPAQRKPHPLDCSEADAGQESVIDRDDAGWRKPVASPAPTLHTGSREFEVDCVDDSDYQLADPDLAAAPLKPAGPPVQDYSAQRSRPDAPAEETRPVSRPFNNSLITSGEDEA